MYPPTLTPLLLNEFVNATVGNLLSSHMLLYSFPPLACRWKERGRVSEGYFHEVVSVTQ